MSCRAVTTEQLPSRELELINDSKCRRLFTEIVQRPGEHGIIGSNVNEGIPACLQWALNETPLQYSPKEKRMQVADNSEQVGWRTSSDKTQAEVVRLFACRSLPEGKCNGLFLTGTQSLLL